VLGRRHELRGRARPEREQGEEEPSRGERRGTSRRCVSTRERDGNHEALAEYFPSRRFAPRRVRDAAPR
jgi:hypothetical protein